MDTDEAWRVWGERDPYFAVLTQERFGKGRIDSHRVEFFESGRRVIDEALQRYERQFQAMPDGSALDFGCGVGRLSIALGERFGRVVGLDISPAMLAEAEANAKAAGRDNLRFALSDDDLSNAPGQFDFVNTCLVLQHIPSARGLRILRRLLEKIAPGGGCNVHVSVRRRPRASREIAYWLRFHVPFAERILNAALERRPKGPAMQMNEYPLDIVLRMFCNAGLREVVTVVDDTDGYLMVSLLARKPLLPHSAQLPLPR